MVNKFLLHIFLSHSILDYFLMVSANPKFCFPDLIIYFTVALYISYKLIYVKMFCVKEKFNINMTSLVKKNKQKKEKFEI